MRHLWLLLREAGKSAWATKGFTLVTASVTTVLTALLLSIVGQAQHQNSLMVEGFTTPERRTITFTSTDTTPILNWDDCPAITAAEEVDSCWSLGRSFDVHNPLLSTGRVSARMIRTDWQSLPVRIITGRLPTANSEAIVEGTTARSLGLDDTGGVIEDTNQRQWSVVGTFRSTQPHALTGVLIPSSSESGVPRTLNIVAHSPDGVPAVIRLATTILAPGSPGDLKISTTEQLGELQGTLAQGISRGGNTVVFGVFAVNWFTIAILCLLMVRARTLEFGQRRALGASRRWLLTMVLTQGVLTVTPAAALGALIGTLWISTTLHLLLPWQLSVWLISWQVTCALTAQGIPAVVACLRDPVRVLRSP